MEEGVAVRVKSADAGSVRFGLSLLLQGRESLFQDLGIGEEVLPDDPLYVLA